MQTCMTEAATEPGSWDADGLPGQNNVTFLLPGAACPRDADCVAGERWGEEGREKRGSFSG